MDRDSFDVVNGKSMPREKRFQRGQAEVKNVFVINRIELVLLDEIHRVREFENNPPVWLQQSPQPGNKIVRARRVSKNVVAQDQIRLPSPSSEFLRKFFAEKFHHRLDPRLLRHLRNVR